jgi:hypothetical protein
VLHVVGGSVCESNAVNVKYKNTDKAKKTKFSAERRKYTTPQKWDYEGNLVVSDVGIAGNQNTIFQVTESVCKKVENCNGFSLYGIQN